MSKPMTDEELKREIRRLREENARQHEREEALLNLEKALREENAQMRALIKAWLGWFEGPYAEGVGYIDPPLTSTRALLDREEP